MATWTQQEMEELIAKMTKKAMTDAEFRKEVLADATKALEKLAGKPLPEPPSGAGSLEEGEARYRELDIRHQLLRQIGIEEDRMDEKLELCRSINRFLKEHKDEYLRRCRQCGRRLPATHPFGVCDQCFGAPMRAVLPVRRKGKR